MTWRGSRIEIGSGTVGQVGSTWRLELPAATAARYSDAQIDDTTGRRRRQFLWMPPLRLALRARFSHSGDSLLGTAGFGFWNLPFGPGAGRMPALPRALWFFFGSPPHDVPLAVGVPGCGWKAASLDASRPAALAWAPLAPLALLAMRNETLYRRLWPRIQRALGVHEALAPADLDRWHDYLLVWQPGEASFWVDGLPILRCNPAPRGPLGFVAWIDNQYAVATPRGRFAWGLLDVPRHQWLEVAHLSITPA